MVVPGPNQCRLGRSCASYDLTWPHYPHVSALVLPSFKCVTFALFGGRHMRDPRVQQQGNVFSAPPEVGRAGAGPISPVLQLFIFVDLASSAFTSDPWLDVPRSAARTRHPAAPRSAPAHPSHAGSGRLQRSGGLFNAFGAFLKLGRVIFTEGGFMVRLMHAAATCAEV